MQKFLKFNKESHKYSIGAQILPSVTQIIRHAGEETDYSGIPEWILRRAADIGEGTHDTISRYFDYDHSLYHTDKSVTAYLEAFARFLRENEITCFYSELLLYCACHAIAGTVDFVGTLNGSYTICDLKTTNKLNTPYVELQTAAYLHLAETFFRETFFDERISETISTETFSRNIIHLKRSGTYDIHECTDEDAWPTYERMVMEYWEELGGIPEL